MTARAARLHRTLADAATKQRHRLERLLEDPDEERRSPLEVLRAGPRKLTSSEAAEAFERLAAIVSVGVGDLVVDAPAAGCGPWPATALPRRPRRCGA